MLEICLENIEAVSMVRERHFTPAELVIKSFGGVRKTAKALGKSPNCIHKWWNPNTKNGKDGLIPTQNLKPILEKAKELGIPLGARELIFGRTIVVGEKNAKG